MVKNLGLLKRIVLVVILAFFLDYFILIQIGSMYVFSIIFILFICSILIAICSVLFYFILKSRYSKFVNKKRVNILCIVLFILILIPAIFHFFDIVPPKEVTNYWECDEGQEMYETIVGMDIIYDSTFARRDGYLFYNESMQKYMEEFDWKYNIFSNEITLTQYHSDYRDRDLDKWTLTLRLDIETKEEPHYTMTTYYVSSSPDFPFDATLFDGVSWTGAYDFNDQGY